MATAHVTPETVTSIAAICAAIGGIVAAILGYLNRRKVDAAKAAADRAKIAAEAVDRKLIDIGDKVYALDERVDGRLSELLKTNREKAEAQIQAATSAGIAEGEQRQRDRHAAPE